MSFHRITPSALLRGALGLAAVCLFPPLGFAAEVPDALIDRYLNEVSEPTLRVEKSLVPGRPRVVIDAGHGGVDLGAQSATGLLEKDLSLDLALELREALKREAVRRAAPVDIRLTRESDRGLSLSERAETANDTEASIFVSLHGNHAGSRSLAARARGFEVYFLNERGTDAAAERLASKENGAEGTAPVSSIAEAMIADVLRSRHVEESGELAEEVHRALAKAVPGKNRGVRQAPFRVLSKTSMPSVLVEVGFLSHPAESQKLENRKYRARLTKAIASGLLNFLARKQPFG